MSKPIPTADEALARFRRNVEQCEHGTFRIAEKDARVILATIDRLDTAIRWALGEDVGDGKDFRPREEGEGAYWWRNELRERAEKGS